MNLKQPEKKPKKIFNRHNVITLNDFKRGFGKQMYSSGTDDLRNQQRNAARTQRKKRHASPKRTARSSRPSTAYSSISSTVTGLRPPSSPSVGTLSPAGSRTTCRIF